MNDNQTQSLAPTQNTPESPEAPTIEPPIQATDSIPTDTPPVAPEAPRDTLTPTAGVFSLHMVK